MNAGQDQQIYQARVQVQQLRNERNIRRIPVSQAVHQLISYTQDFRNDDSLLNGFPSDKMNPYRPKSSFQCNVL